MKTLNDIIWNEEISEEIENIENIETADGGTSTYALGAYIEMCCGGGFITDGSGFMGIRQCI